MKKNEAKMDKNEAKTDDFYDIMDKMSSFKMRNFGVKNEVRLSPKVRECCDKLYTLSEIKEVMRQIIKTKLLAHFSDKREWMQLPRYFWGENKEAKKKRRELVKYLANFAKVVTIEEYEKMDFSEKHKTFSTTLATASYVNHFVLAKMKKKFNMTTEAEREKIVMMGHTAYGAFDKFFSMMFFSGAGEAMEAIEKKLNILFCDVGKEENISVSYDLYYSRVTLWGAIKNVAKIEIVDGSGTKSSGGGGETKYKFYVKEGIHDVMSVILDNVKLLAILYLGEIGYLPFGKFYTSGDIRGFCVPSYEYGYDFGEDLKNDMLALRKTIEKNKAREAKEKKKKWIWWKK